MSDNLTKEQRLTAIVLSYRGENELNPLNCALARAFHVLGEQDGDLVTVAQRFGFSELEAKGIMRGWDTERGAKWLPFRYAANQTDAIALGRKLYRMVFP